MARRHFVQCSHFLIRIIHHQCVVHKPCIAVGSGILHRNLTTALCTEDEPARVEHIQHRIERIGIHGTQVIDRELGLSRHHGNGIHRRFTQCLIHIAHFWSDMLFDKFLIAAQLGRMITTHRTIEIRSGVVVKGRNREVEHTIIALVTRFRKDKLVCLRLLQSSIKLRTREHAIVQVSLVHHPHIHQANHQQSNGKNGCWHTEWRNTILFRWHSLFLQHLVFIGNLSALGEIPVHQHRTNHDDDDGAPSISTHHSRTHRGDAGKDAGSHAIVEIALLHVLIHGIAVGC